MQGGGRRWDGGNGGGNLCFRKGGSWDVLSCDVLLRIESKVLVHKGILGGHRKEVFLLVIMILGFVGGNIGKGFKVVGRDWENRGTGDDIGRGVRDVKEWKILDIIKSGPDKFW